MVPARLSISTQVGRQQRLGFQLMGRSVVEVDSVWDSESESEGSDSDVEITGLDALDAYRAQFDSECDSSSSFSSYANDSFDMAASRMIPTPVFTSPNNSRTQRRQSMGCNPGVLPQTPEPRPSEFPAKRGVSRHSSLEGLKLMADFGAPVALPGGALRMNSRGYGRAA